MPNNITHLPPLDTLIGVRQPIDAMVGEVAGLVGGDDSPSAQAKALAFLDRAADTMNAAGVYLFRLKEEPYTPSSGATTINLPTDWGWPTDPFTLYDSASRVKGMVEWVPWEYFRAAAQDTSRNGVPSIASVKSEHDDTASIHPPVDTAQVSTMKVCYYARVQRPSEVEEIYLTPETREALIAGGEFYMMRYRYKHQANVWMPFERLFLHAIDRAKGAAARRQGTYHNFAAPDDGFNTADASAGGGGRVFVEI